MNISTFYCFYSLLCFKTLFTVATFLLQKLQVPNNFVFDN